MPAPLNLDPRLAAIHAAEYPRFSDAEMARRRSALARVMAEAEVDHLLVCGEQRAGTGVGWLTSWPATVEAYVIVAPGEPQLMYMEWYNHWPLARKLARDTEVRWGEHRGFEKVIADLKARSAKRIGLMGALGLANCRKIEAVFGPLVDLNRELSRNGVRSSSFMTAAILASSSLALRPVRGRRVESRVERGRPDDLTP